MRLLSIFLLINLILSTSAFAGAEELLITKAKSWASRDRIDLARKALDKLFQISPEHPDGLARLAYIEIQEGRNFQANEALKQLRKSQPKHKDIASIKLLLQMNAVDEKKLQQARLWSKAGQTQDAIKAYKELFPEGMPTAQLRYEYWLLVGRTKVGWNAAKKGLQNLATDYPNSLRYRLASIEHQLSKSPSNKTLLKELKTFLDKPNYERQAAASWRRAVLRLSKSPQSIPYYEDFLSYDPEDDVIRHYLESQKEARAEQKKLAAIELKKVQLEAKTKQDAEVKQRQGPLQIKNLILNKKNTINQKTTAEKRALLVNNHAYIAKRKGLILLEKGDLGGAEKKFLYALKFRPNDTDASGGLGLIYLRQARYEQSRIYFSKAQVIAKMLKLDTYSKWQSLMKTSIFWGLLSQSDKLIDNKDYVLAQKKIEKALSMEQTSYAINKLARVQSLTGEKALAKESYQKALALEPNNDTTIESIFNAYLEQKELVKAHSFLNNLSVNQRAALGKKYHILSATLFQAKSERLLSQGKVKKGIVTLETAHGFDPNNAWLLYDLAKLYQKNGDAEKALPLFEKSTKTQPLNNDMLFAYALFLDSTDQTDMAVKQLQKIPLPERSDNVKATRSRLIDGLRQKKDEEIKAKEKTRLAKIKKDEEAILLRQQKNNLNKQRLVEQNKLLIDGSNQQALNNERSIVISMDYKATSRNQSDGKSSVSNREIPIEIRIPSGDDGDVFIRLDYVSLDAGALDINDADEVSEFGQGLFCFPACSSDASDESISGHYIGIGYEQQDLRIDIGTTPKAFLVSNLIGGIAIDGDWSIFSWGVDLSRRPLAGSKLTHAGSKDIHSGKTWGGILLTGVSFSLSQDDGEEVGYWSNFDVHNITGKNVADNKRLRLMGGVYWRLIDDEEFQLTLGLNVQFWRHDKVLDEFTFGQGAYYSPNRYRSLAIPLSLRGRLNHHLSYRLRASVSKSRTYENRTAFFPNDDELQTSAESIQGGTGITPFFNGGHGGGVGFSLSAAAEFKINNELFVGIEYSTEKSDSYHPESLLFYLRYTVEGDEQPAWVPPTPLGAYSDF